MHSKLNVPFCCHQCCFAFDISVTKIHFRDFSYELLFIMKFDLHSTGDNILPASSCFMSGIQMELEQIIVKCQFYSHPVQHLLTSQALLPQGDKVCLLTKSEIRKPRCKETAEQMCSKTTLFVLSRLQFFIGENGYAFFSFELDQFHHIMPLFIRLDICYYNCLI